MGSLSDYAEKKVLDHLVGKTALTMPTAYIALSTADPLDAGSGIAEPVANGYTRKATVAADWNAAAGASPGTTTNANALSFPQASGSWGTITHFAIFDALSGGNMLFQGQLTVSKAVASGDTLSFAAGQISLTMD